MSERRASLAIVVGSLAVFALLLVLVPPFFRSFDEAKYVGIGYNVLSGAGPRTVFGAVFLPHSPLWPMALVGPSLSFGGDPLDWGYLLNGVAGVALLALVAALGWRIRPAVGALAAVGYLSVPYLHDLTRTARLDVPAAALALAYVVVGIDAVRRGSMARGALAGAIFAVAFLVKEIALPFAPVPFLVGILGGRPWSTTIRVVAATVAVAALGTAWWFAMYADFTGTVYRLGTSSAVLVPLYVGVAGIVVAGLALPWIASRPATREWLARTRTRVPETFIAHGRAIVAWGGAFGWLLALTVFFDRNPELKGNGLFRLDQYALYARTWLPQMPLLLAAVVGAALSLPARRSATPEQREGFDALYITLVCSLPLVLLVVAVGEPPRNYLAQIGVLAALAAAGWLWAAGRLWEAGALRRLTSPIGAVLVGAIGAGLGGVLARIVGEPTIAGLAIGGILGLALGAGIVRVNRRQHADEPSRFTAGMAISVLTLSLVVASLLLASHALGTRALPRAAALESAVGTSAAWIEANVPAGATIGFGSFLGYETASELRPGDFRMVQLDQKLAVVDPTAPLALSTFGEPPVEDWLAIESSRRETEFYVFRAAILAEQVRRSGISIYVYNTGPITSVPALLGALTPEHGFTEIASWSYPIGTEVDDASTTATHIFAVDQARVGFDGASMYTTWSALDRLVGVLERDPDTSPETAANLRRSIAIWPSSTPPGDLLERLDALAAR